VELSEVRALESADELVAAWPVVRELRPHLDQAAFLAACQTQRVEGYRAIGLFAHDACVGFAGYRLQTMLAHGRFLYVDDLVVAESARGSGAGAVMLDWLIEAARREACVSLQLDSGTQRHGAHAFYFRQGMSITSFHFRRALEA